MQDGGDLFGSTGAGTAFGPNPGSVARGTEGARPLTANRPLADRLRPRKLDDVVGQGRALSPEGPIGRMRASNRLSSLILWGPPGCGKTTLARLLAESFGRPLLALSAVMSGVPDLKRAFADARRMAANGPAPVLFIDEIHRYNRAQQDGLLHEVEAGAVTLLGATTENPSFALNPALVSRCRVVVLERLDDAALADLLRRAEAASARDLPLDEEARARLLDLADGDGRHLLNLAEVLLELPPEPVLGVEGLGRAVDRRLPVYDKAQEAHYNLISALHKSVRASDPDAALYWLCRMLQAGEDPRYLARRLVRMASEDIGAADPQALPLSIAAAQAFERLGPPEGELALAQCAVHLATAPKSDAVYRAFKQANVAAREHGSLPPPMRFRNAPTKLMRELGYGEGYVNDHTAPERFSGQSGFPDELERQEFYQPGDQGAERAVAERLAAWRRSRDHSGGAEG